MKKIWMVLVGMMGLMSQPALAGDKPSIEQMWKSAVELEKKDLKMKRMAVKPRFPIKAMHLLKPNVRYSCKVQLLVDEKGKTIDARATDDCLEVLRARTVRAFKTSRWIPATSASGEPLGVVRLTVVTKYSWS